MTDSVVKLVKKTKYPGMKILTFAFNETEKSEYLPYTYDKNCVVYTGTHDNETVLGWYKNMSRKDRAVAKRYLGINSAKQVCDRMIRECLSSVADTAVIPMQDYLELDNTARMNVPSTLGTNWKWRMKKEALTKELAAHMRSMASVYGRM